MAEQLVFDFEEIWKPVPGFAGYEASSRGRIRSPHKGVLTLSQRKKQRYLVVGIGHGKSFLVHRLVALAFLGPPAPGEEVCHRNGERTDNRPSNLRWGTRKSNVADTFAHGRGNAADRNGRAKLDWPKVIAIRENTSMSRRDLAEYYNVNINTISYIRTRKHWK